MKKILFVIAALFISLGAFAQSKNIDKFLNSLEDGDEYGVVTVNKEMFKLIASMDADFDEEEGLKELVRDIKLLKIYILEDEASYDDFKQVHEMARGSSMTELLSVKDGAERVYLYTNSSGDDEYVKDLLLLVRDDDQNVFIKMDGRINLKSLAKLTDNMNIDGFEHLRKIDESKNKF